MQQRAPWYPDMKSHEVWKQVLPRGYAEAYAEERGLSVGYIRAWSRPSPTDPVYRGTGERNDLDRLLEQLDGPFRQLVRETLSPLVEVLGHANPEDTADLPNPVVFIRQWLMEQVVETYFRPLERRYDELQAAERRQRSGSALRPPVVVNADLLRQILEMRDRCDAVLRSLQDQPAVATADDRAA